MKNGNDTKENLNFGHNYWKQSCYGLQQKERRTVHFICRRKTGAVNSQRLLKDFTSECLALSLSRFPFRFCSASPFPAFLQFFLMILVYCSAAIKVKAASDTFISISMKQPKGWENHAGVKASSESYT